MEDGFSFQTIQSFLEWNLKEICFVHEYKSSLRREVNRASSGRIPLKTPLESLFNFQGHTTLWVGFSSLVLNPKGRRGSSLMVFLILCSFPVLFSGLQHCVQYPPCISADLFLLKHKPSSALYCILLFSRIVLWICTNLLSILIALTCFPASHVSNLSQPQVPVSTFIQDLCSWCTRWLVFTQWSLTQCSVTSFWLTV